MGLTQAALAEAMGLACKHLNALCNGRRRSDRWDAIPSPVERFRIDRAKPLGAAA